MKPLVYIAGPYSGENVWNTQAAVYAAEQVEAYGCDVVIPHLSMLWDLISPAPYERWLERDQALLARCDAVYRLPGDSRGADCECAYARHELRIPVFYDLDAAREWVTSRSD